MMGAPVGISLITALAAPAIIIGLPILVGATVWYLLYNSINGFFVMLICNRGYLFSDVLTYIGLSKVPRSFQTLRHR